MTVPAGKAPVAKGPTVEHPRHDVPVSDAAHDSTALRRARRRALALASGLAAVAAVLTVTLLVDPIDSWVQPFDDAWLRWIQQHRVAWLTSIADALNVIGSSAVTIPLRIVIVIVLAFRRRWTQLMAFVAAVVISELCIGPLKHFVDRPRPPAPLVTTSDSSFPSGHSIAAAVTAFGVVVAFLPRGRRRLMWIGVASFLAGMMAWSRTYLGAHWATDTIAGICIGVACALGSEVLFESTRTKVAEHEEAHLAGAVEPPLPP